MEMNEHVNLEIIGSMIITITIIHDENLYVTDNKKIILLLCNHRIMKNTANFIIKYMEHRYHDLYLYLNSFDPIVPHRPIIGWAILSALAGRYHTYIHTYSLWELAIVGGS